MMHTFHIPVMGTGFSIDTPVKVAHYGISSVISIMDDELIEKMRASYCKDRKIPFEPISKKEEDHRARRITAYLNLVDRLVKENFGHLKLSFLEKYMVMLPDASRLKKEYREFILQNPAPDEVRPWIEEHLPPGSIDVNILTKIDKQNFRDGRALPAEYNDAHAALRGFALSTLRSSLVLSAGLNPRLYGYAEQFGDFYPDERGELKKKLIIKVSDFRSARIQGHYLAKKGLWVSEYRVESGLNCGGHAFATDGFLLGPILEEFKLNRQLLVRTTHETLTQALRKKGRPVPEAPLELKISAQGGVGTAEEHQFLLNYYGINSVGWGSPFLLVPEVTNVDPETRRQLAEATEKDLYLSRISPLGVRFYSLKDSAAERERSMRVEKGWPGSPCIKQNLQSNTEFTTRPICTASRQYQRLKIEELDSLGLPDEERRRRYERIVEKTCLCDGLSAGALSAHGFGGNPPALVCPGPNLAYFSTITSLKEMVDHIYGRIDLIRRTDRPHMFVQELKLYIAFLKEKASDLTETSLEKHRNSLSDFQANLREGIQYYRELISRLKQNFVRQWSVALDELDALATELGAVTAAAAQP